jgi:hypothetical protein
MVATILKSLEAQGLLHCTTTQFGTSKSYRENTLPSFSGSNNKPAKEWRAFWDG